MTGERRIEANHPNGKKGGPRTSEGKAVALNDMKRGLLSLRRSST
jgi:hypothetical protein